MTKSKNSKTLKKTLIGKENIPFVPAEKVSNQSPRVVLDRSFVANYLKEDRIAPQDEPIVQIIESDDEDCVFVAEEKAGPKTTKIALLERKMSEMNDKNRQLLKTIDILKKQKNEKENEFAKKIEEWEQEKHQLELALTLAPQPNGNLDESWTSRLLRVVSNDGAMELINDDIQNFFDDIVVNVDDN